MSDGPRCLNAHCEIRETVQGDSACVCTIEGIIVEGTPSPPPPPQWPELPGWPEPGYFDPGGDGGGPGGEEPCDYGCPQPWTAELSCSAGVTRGGNGGCTLAVDPSTAYEWTTRWTFYSDDGELTVSLPTSGTSLSWEGKLVASGRVKVEFRAGGMDAVALSELHVNKRQGSDWHSTLGGSFWYGSGGLPFPSGYDNLAMVCHPENLCAPPPGDSGGHEHYFVQPQLAQHGYGYTEAQVTNGGPNHELFYVASNAISTRMRSGINPEYDAGGIARPYACGPFQTVSFWDFNHHEDCGNGGPTWGAQFKNWLFHYHEDLHAQKAWSYVANNPAYDARFVVEEAVRQTGVDLRQLVRDRINLSGTCVGWAALLHGSALSGVEHPAASFPVWFWNASNSPFFAAGSGIPFWGADATPPNPCLEHMIVVW